MACKAFADSIEVISSLDLLNVYQGSVIRTVSVGMMRIVTIVVFGLGVTMVAPRMFFDPDQSRRARRRAPKHFGDLPSMFPPIPRCRCNR